jgi:hypothetical protein
MRQVSASFKLWQDQQNARMPVQLQINHADISKHRAFSSIVAPQYIAHRLNLRMTTHGPH